MRWIECLTLPERLLRRPEHGLVVHRAISLVLPPVDGDGARQSRELADDRIAEERGLGDGAEPPRQRGGEEDAVHETLLVSGRDDEGPGGGHPLKPDHVDAPVEEPDEKPREGSPETGGCRLSQG